MCADINSFPSEEEIKKYLREIEPIKSEVLFSIKDENGNAWDYVDTHFCGEKEFRIRNKQPLL